LAGKVGLSFPRIYRLLKRSDFLNVQQSGVRFSTDNIIFLYKINDSGHVRCGFTVSRKNGNAVRRNTIRRRMKEAVRMNIRLLSGFSTDIVCLPRHRLVNAPFTELVHNVAQFVEYLEGKLIGR